MHIVLAIFFLVGWMFPSIKPIYLPLLIAWPLSWLLFGYCPVTKWELLLRQKYNPQIDTNAEAIQYYSKKFFSVHIPPQPIYVAGITVFFVLLFLTTGPDFL
jgi:hypothetical protein